MRIDAHAHIVGPAYRAELVQAATFQPAPATLAGLLAMMDRFAIDASIVSVGPPGATIGDRRTARRVARTVNEELAGVVEAAPGRLAALGSLPLGDIDDALAELAFALDELSLDGVMLLSNEADTYVGDPSREALLAELDRRGAYVLVHPTVPAYRPPLAHPPWLYEFPFETTRVITNLIYGGAFERHRSIRWQFPHLGGTAPFLAGRLSSLAEREPALATEAPRGADAYLCGPAVSYDTGLSNHAAAIRSALQVLLPAQLMFGTDWPYGVLPEAAGDPAPELVFLDDTARRALDSERALELVPRLGAAKTHVDRSQEEKTSCP